MCTLLLGLGVVAPATVLLGANRDERPQRPSDPPGVLVAEPRVVGGRDRAAGGTWLAVRERRAVVAMLNRRPSPADLARAWPRSRGLLALAVASALEAPGDAARALPLELPPGLPRSALARAWEAVTREAYAPFSLVFASREASWMVARDSGGEPFARSLEPGWHVLTHTELDDPNEPRAAWLARDLERFAPRTRAEGEAGLAARLRAHAEGHPAVCLHDGPMVTVSAALVWLGAGEAGYAHAEGRPCERPFEDRGALLTGSV